MSRHTQSVVSSALWAAAGDAVGWIGELTDERGVRRRVGSPRIQRPVPWRRKLGRNGPTVQLPAGTYSDDTQLRLAVSRAIRGSGEFDVEAFAKVELPVWLGYLLGGGRGTVAAATNLSKNSVAWFSNFFMNSGGPRYVESGGNGAAMRIQPHVWKSAPSNPETFIPDVLRDAIVTHGAAQGFGGAVFHALCLAHALDKGNVPEPSLWRVFLLELKSLPEIVRSDSQLSTFWIGAWEREADKSFQSALDEQVDAMVSLLPDLDLHASDDRHDAYHKALVALGGLDESTRGAGLISALAAVVLAWLFRDAPIEEALLVSANALSSDTDTIGTMAGAILGAAFPQDLQWKLQDRSYIESEARRLAAIAAGQDSASFAYPDLATWEPPSSHSDSVVRTSTGLSLCALGPAAPEGETWAIGESEWQWLRLEFGQTVLAKRRKLMPQAKESQFASTHADDGSESNSFSGQTSMPSQRRLPLDTKTLQGADQRGTQTPRTATNDSPRPDLDALTDRVINSGFEPSLLGSSFLDAIDGDRPLEQAVAFASIIAKAFVVRRRRRSSTAS